MVNTNLGNFSDLNVAALISAWLFAALIFPRELNMKKFAVQGANSSLVDPWIDELLAAGHDAADPNDPRVQRVYEEGFDRVCEPSRAQNPNGLFLTSNMASSMQ